MRTRTIYFKVMDMERSIAFWEKLLELSPNRKSEKWAEISIGEVRIGLLLNDFGDELTPDGHEFEICTCHD